MSDFNEIHNHMVIECSTESTADTEPNDHCLWWKNDHCLISTVKGMIVVYGEGMIIV